LSRTNASVQQPILERQRSVANGEAGSLPEDLRVAIGKLMPFRDQDREGLVTTIPYEIQDYLELVE